MELSRKAKTKLLFEHAEGRDLTRLAEYEKVGGYESLKKALKMEPSAVLDELLAADVRGRGGAGFPMGRKASFLPKPDQTTKPIYLVANADESERGHDGRPPLRILRGDRLDLVVEGGRRH